MKRFIYLIAVLFFLVMSTTADAQVTGTRLINKGTLVTGSLRLTGTQPTVFFTDQAVEGVKGITTLTLFDAAGFGPTDSPTLAGITLNGNMSVTGTSGLAATTITGTLNLVNGNVAFIGGANAQGTTISTGTDKAFRIGMPHYNTSSAPVAILYATSTATTIQLGWGGGTGQMNAATTHSWLTTTTTTGGVGTERMRLTSSGFLGIGTTGPTTALDLGAGVLTTTGGIVTGTLTINSTLTANVGATNPILLGRNVSFTTFGAISLNGSFTDTSMIGFFGGGDSNFYVNTTGKVILRPGGTANNSAFVLGAGGNLGLGIGSTIVDPTARLSLTGGTTTTAQINLAAGTLKTTPTNGDVEYNGTNLFYTRTGGTRETVITGTTASAPTSTSGTAPAPNGWMRINISGTSYLIPTYTP